MQVAEKLTAAGVPCSLITGAHAFPLHACALSAASVHATAGQEQRIVPGAQHLACTVEMTDMARTWDAAVIDEIQMLADKQRGSAWTRALLGLPAKRLALCGSPTALPLIQHLVSETGE